MFFTTFLVFLVLALRLIIYILTYQNLLWIYTNNFSEIQKYYSYIVLFPFPLFCTTIVIHIMFTYVPNPKIHCYIITLYNFMFFREAERINESKYIFREFVTSIFIYHFRFFSFVPFVWIIIWCHFTPIQLFSHLPSLHYYCYIYYIFLCYRPNNSVYV